jgi:hypothetical protein
VKSEKKETTNLPDSPFGKEKPFFMTNLVSKRGRALNTRLRNIEARPPLITIYDERILNTNIKGGTKGGLWQPGIRIVNPPDSPLKLKNRCS